MLNNLRVGWRQFIADPGHTVVIMLGLSVAVACCQLVVQVVLNEVVPDPEVPQPGQVVSIEFRGNLPGAQDVWREQAPYVLADALRQSSAPVSAVARSQDGSGYVVHAGERSVRLGFEFGDPELVDIFGLRASAGDLRAALRRPDSIALTEASAHKLFPDGAALGKTVVVRGHALTVAALVPARPRLFEAAAEAFVGFDSPVSTIVGNVRTDWFWTQGNVYARVAPGFQPADVGAAAQALFDGGPGPKALPTAWTREHKGADLRATPLTRHYLYGAGGHGRGILLLGIAVGAVLMLALAVANYVNLASVRTLARAREIAVRKTLGASPWRVTVQFIVESMLAVAVAAAFGLLLAWWLAPTIGRLLSLSLTDGLFAPDRLALLAAATVLLGVITGLYPARIALTVSCIGALAGRSHDESAAGRGLRRAMTALQFAVALVIAGGAGAMLWQNHHVASLSHGIRTAGLLSVDVPDGFSGKSDALNAAFREALSHEPGVQAMAWSMDVPGRGEAWASTTVSRDGQGPVVVNKMPVDANFFDVYGVNIVAGKPRTAPPEPPADAASSAAKPERLVVLDLASVRALGFASPREAIDTLIGSGDDYRASGGDPMRVVAVASDIRLEMAHDTPRPHMFVLSRQPQFALTLKGSRVEQLRQAVDRVWPRFYPEDESEVQTVEDALGVPYQQEHRLAQMAMVTTVIALGLSAFGVYALAAYTVRRSAREIVVRKLYGAGPARIARLMACEFVPLLCVAAVVGLPIAGWLAHAWIETFTERSPTAMLALPVALLAVVAMTALAALRHVAIAMRMRPTQALRD